MKELFNTNRSSTVLSRFKAQLDGMNPQGDFEVSRNSMIGLVLGAMANEPKQWDEQCQMNINWIGDQFINRLAEEVKELSKDKLDDICAMSFRFLLELYLSIKNDLSIEFERARKFVVNNIDSFDEHAKDQIQFALIDMPISIFKELSNSDAIESIKDLSSTLEKATNLKEEWDKEIQDKEKKIDGLKEALEQYESGFNFVGLYQGFDDLSTEKNGELKSLVFWLRALSVIIVAPICIELSVVYAHIDKIDAIREGLVVSIFPVISLISISIYYFRVLLFNYKSVKSQLLQIDLRKTLCRFIQSYVEYSKEIKDKDVDSLTKFENIIFSGIVSDDVNLPSTYDGIEQIGRLIKSAKS